MGMRLAKQARLSLKGQWKGAVLAQWMVLAAGLFLLLLEVAALRLTGLGMEKVIHIDEIDGDPGLLLHAAVIVGIVALDPAADLSSAAGACGVLLPGDGFPAPRSRFPPPVCAAIIGGTDTAWPFAGGSPFGFSGSCGVLPAFFPPP